MGMMIYVAYLHFKECLVLLTGFPMMQDLAEGPEHPAPVDWL